MTHVGRVVHNICTVAQQRDLDPGYGKCSVAHSAKTLSATLWS